MKNRIVKKKAKEAEQAEREQQELEQQTTEESAAGTAEPQDSTEELSEASHAPEQPEQATDAPVAEADAEAAAAHPTDEASAESSESDGETSPATEDEAKGPEFPVPSSPFDLIFAAPDLATVGLLPAREEEDDDDDQDSGGADRRSRRGRSRSRRSRSNRQDAAEEQEVITEPQKLKGSTRLEAKKQRRRDGREAGRRRNVVTESEFLARRESVDRHMVVRSMHDRVQIAVLEDGVLVEHYVAKSSETSMIGDVFLGRVQNVLPSMEAAFVDIGRGRNAVLYSGEVDWDAAELDGQPRKIENALKPGDTVLVQVTKDPVGHKGARLTSQISLPGRYLVTVPGGAMNGISRKLPDTERSRLKKILKQVLPQDIGVIVRTAAEGATQEQLQRDVDRLTKQWKRIQELSQKGNAPHRLHGEPDLLVKIVRDVFNEDFTKLIIQGTQSHKTISEYLEAIAPELLERVEEYEGTDDPFDHFRIKEQIEKALDRKVWLPSGGSLVIDRTEAMTVIDVNTGRFVGQGGNLEETVTKNNLEAAEEIVRQLRLRDIGGIIVIDFIDMVLETNRDLVSRRLIECLGRDRTKHQVAEVTSLGLVQMTRKKLGLGLLESYSEPCEACAARGIIVHHEPISKGGRESGKRRGRGARREQQNDQQKTNGNGGAQEITEDARKGLSRIASAHKKAEPGAEEAASEEVELESNPQRDRGRGGGRDRKERAAKRDREQGRENEGADVRILDIPVAAQEEQAAAQKPKAEDLDDLLGGALDKLQQPEPGTGKAARRSRRASSGIIRAGDDV
ncbi:Rne/Rng family ribonuclease [uncultured Agrococcus sp.]|uniref:Rne/Rng family ribonuclease n=1 Tax=uncultured Agrococcus sp. TaxID=382258 RepID=UPI0025EC0017|nr:Rne/Rng family ribonuclease [uncultured Agrococcus sp.]